MEEIHRRVQQGFQLDAASLQGFVNSVKRHVAGNMDHQYKVSFKDGTVQVFQSEEEIISLPNVGRKEVVSIHSEFYIKEKNSYISVKISDPTAKGMSEDSVEYHVRSEDGSWIKAIQVECEEFCHGIRKNNVAAWMKGHAFEVSIVPVLLLMAVMVVFATSLDSKATIEDLRKNLSVSMPPSEVIIRYESWRRSMEPKIDSKLLLFPMLATMGWAMIARGDFITSMFKTYIFYFGGNIQIINQRRAMHALVWVSIILAIIVGVGVNWLSSRILRI